MQILILKVWLEVLCLANKFLGEAAAAGPQTPHWVAGV